MRTIVVALLLVLGGCLFGCTWLDPGGQVQRGLSQSKTYQWPADGGFTVVGQGAQTEKFTMAGGEIRFKINEDGEEVIDFENSVLEYYLKADPSADNASNAMVAALQASTQQAQMVQRSFDNALSLIIPLVMARYNLPATTMPAGP